MFDFNLPITENIKDKPLVCAHRGVSGGNIACNTMAAFKGALLQGADMIELDVSKTLDGKYYVFHPGMEPSHLRFPALLSTVTSKTVDKLHFVNQDRARTQQGVEKLEDVLDFLKGKCYINVDKYWKDIPGITECIRKCGVEKQCVVKTPLEDKYYNQILKYAPDIMYLPVIKKEDNVTDKLRAMGLNCIGAEVCFSDESSPLASDEYIEAMHDKGMVIFANAIIYYYKAQLAAGHSDDNSLLISPDYGWGWLIDKGYDIIQTDWCGTLKAYMNSR